MTTVAVTDTNIFFSPYNWFSDGSGTLQSNNILPSSSYAQAVNTGAYIKLGFTGTSISIDVDVSAMVGQIAGDMPTIEWSIDGGAWTRYQLTTSDTTLSLGSGLSAGSHTIKVVFVGVATVADDRWITPVMSLKIDSFEIDSGASTQPPIVSDKSVVFYGDSHTEGREALDSGLSVANQNARLSYAWYIAEALGVEFGTVGFGAQGYHAAVGAANLPDLEDAYDQYFDSQSRLFAGKLSPEPVALFCTHGDNGGATAALTTAVANMQANFGSITNETKIYFVPPPNYDAEGKLQLILDGITVGGRIYYLDTYQNFSGLYPSGVHMSAAGQEAYANAIMEGIADLTTGLLGAWDLTDNAASSNVAAYTGSDGTASDNTDTLYVGDGNGPLASGKFANAGLDFNVSDSESVSISSDSVFSGTGARAVSLWFKTAKLTGGAGDNPIFGSGEPISNGNAFNLTCELGVLYLRVKGGARQFGSGGYNDGNWHHLVVQCGAGSDVDGVEAFVDGETVTGTTDAGGTTLIDTLSVIGGIGRAWLAPGTNRYFLGSVAAVKLYSRKLSAAEVAAEFLGGIPQSRILPYIYGTETVGQMLACNPGTWTDPNYGALSYAYQWLRDGITISGATSSTYTLTGADEGAAISCQITTTNDGGTSSAAESNATGAIEAAPVVSDSGGMAQQLLVPGL